jgi:hypothetical protein
MGQVAHVSAAQDGKTLINKGLGLNLDSAAGHHHPGLGVGAGQTAGGLAGLAGGGPGDCAGEDYCQINGFICARLGPSPLGKLPDEVGGFGLIYLAAQAGDHKGTCLGFDWLSIVHGPF